MMFLTGSSVLGGAYTHPTSTSAGSISSFTLRNAEFAGFYAGHNVDSTGVLNTNFYDENGNITYPTVLPSVWDFCTIMYMNFDSNVLGGNVDWEMASLTAMLVKRKKVKNKDISKLLSQAGTEDENTWVTIAERDVAVPGDLNNFEGVDLTPDTGTYTYALVPIISMVEGTYITTDVETKVGRLVIIDKDGVWATGTTDGTCNVTYVQPSSPIETLNNTYPTIVSNTEANYRTVELSGSWYPFDNEEGCKYDYFDNDEIRTAYLEAFLKWLVNKNTKIIKNVDGRRYLCYITTPPSVTFEAESYEMHTVTFGGTEIGNINKTRDLYNCGIINIPEKYVP